MMFERAQLHVLEIKTLILGIISAYGCGNGCNSDFEMEMEVFTDTDTEAGARSPCFMFEHVT